MIPEQEEALTKLGERGSTAARRYIHMLLDRFPELGEDWEVARFYDRTILVEVHIADSDRLGEIAEQMAPVSQDILEDTGEVVVAIPR